jgi:ribosomal protein S18 acetylase RimI-like enzyme
MENKMTVKEIIGYVDDGANYYVSLIGKAKHMNCVIKDNYSYVFPKEGEKGITFIYDVNIDSLNENKRQDILEEMKSLNMPIWWNLKSQFEKEGKIGTVEDEELYMAILPGEEKPYVNESSKSIIKRIDSPELFKIWANHINNILSNGYPDIHPEYHYNLCQDKLMDCYLSFIDNNPVSSATIMNNSGIASLEFIATNPDYRQKGFAKEICSHAICEEILKGTKIITVRAINIKAKELYKKLGFRIYNGIA